MKRVLKGINKEINRRFKGLALVDQKCFSYLADSVPTRVDEFERNEFYVVHTENGQGG